MFKLISVTNRHLCREPLAQRIRKIAEAGANAIILREKDLSESEYLLLAEAALAACKGTDTQCILHSFPSAQLQTKAIHLPLPILRSLSREERERFTTLGASCHSLSDVQEAADLGCTYVTLGHIFATDCKKGLPPRGLPFLEAICRKSELPIYAIGGISPENLASVRDAGAAGACIMSGLMVCESPAAELKALRQALKKQGEKT